MVHPPHALMPSCPQITVMQRELQMVREFQQSKGDMQRQLDHLQASLDECAEAHRVTLHNLEQRFFEEKMTLQKEANRRIAQLAGSAHNEAIRY